eukprot:4998965-Prymnesium_polylepis.1
MIRASTPYCDAAMASDFMEASSSSPNRARSGPYCATGAAVCRSSAFGYSAIGPRPPSIGEATAAATVLIRRGCCAGVAARAEPEMPRADSVSVCRRVSDTASAAPAIDNRSGAVRMRDIHERHFHRSRGPPKIDFGALRKVIR